MEKWLIKAIIILVVIELPLITIVIHNWNKSDIACQELGFENARYINDMEYCEDKESNLHYAKIECKPWYWEECTAKTISVGDVRVR